MTLPCSRRLIRRDYGSCWGSSENTNKNKGKPMPTLYALAVTVGVLAVVATWVSFGPLAAFNVQVWQVFIAWGCHFHCGGKIDGSRDTVICMSFGAVIGMAAVLLAGQLGALGDFAAPLAVGIGATIIVLSSSIKWLAAIPASVYGFAAIAGLWLLGGEDTLGEGATVVNALVPTILSVIAGAIFGYVSEAISGALAKDEAAG